MPPKGTHSYLKNIAIFGASGLGREVLMLIHQINQVAPVWNMVGFYDDNPDMPDIIDKYPYLGNLEALQAVKEPLYVVVAIGNPGIKAQICEKIINPQIQFAVLIHPGVPNEAYQFNEIGEGTIITQGCIITTNIHVGRHVLLNLGCTLGHDVELGDYCSLMPHVNIAGNSVLGKGVYVGTNATVIQFLKVGARAIIGAGAVVHRDLPEAVTAVGIPAKVIKRHHA
ncbi:MAG: acetyltransferase [Adhaeribacter sp.]|nr:acetyltransferase [Adhaeribacter sp.]